MPTYDLALFQPPATPGGLYAQSIQSPSVPARLVSGLEKLGQRFVIELLTELGSLVHLPARGCDFVTALRGGWIVSEFDLYSSFATAVLQAAANLAAEDSDTDPDDERLAGAQLTSVTVAPGSVRLGVNVVSLAGTAILLQVPLEFPAAPAAF